MALGLAIVLRLHTCGLAGPGSTCSIQGADKPPPPNHLFPHGPFSQHGSFIEAYIVFLGLGSLDSVFAMASSTLYQICPVLLYPNPGPPIPKECIFHGSPTGAVPGIPPMSNCIPHLTGDLDPSVAPP